MKRSTNDYVRVNYLIKKKSRVLKTYTLFLSLFCEVTNERCSYYMYYAIHTF